MWSCNPRGHLVTGSKMAKIPCSWNAALCRGWLRHPGVLLKDSPWLLSATCMSLLLPDMLASLCLRTLQFSFSDLCFSRESWVLPGMVVFGRRGDDLRGNQPRIQLCLLHLHYIRCSVLICSLLSFFIEVGLYYIAQAGLELNK